VIPVKDEQDTIGELIAGIAANVDGLSYEVILIDDGSSDDSWDVINQQSFANAGIVRGIRFRTNRGKAAALAAGFEAAAGEIIFTMDADLQDDPTEIPRVIAKIEEGNDLVSGWKQVRHDPWHKVLPSRTFNRMLSRFSKVKLHDHNCGFKCYRREVAKSLKLFGELHRMVPALSGMQGFRVTEIPVTHHARRFGKSKYGIERFIRGFSDMLTLGFLRVYQERPSHFTNTCAVAFAVVASLLAVTSLIVGLTSVSGIVLAMTGLALLGMGAMTMIAGLIAELMIRCDSKFTAQSSVVSRVAYPPRTRGNSLRVPSSVAMSSPVPS
jgi:dolichol-phosphate mannosyltransferase